MLSVSGAASFYSKVHRATVHSSNRWATSHKLDTEYVCDRGGQNWCNRVPFGWSDRQGESQRGSRRVRAMAKESKLVVLGVSSVWLQGFLRKQWPAFLEASFKSTFFDHWPSETPPTLSTGLSVSSILHHFFWLIWDSLTSPEHKIIRVELLQIQ